MSGIVSLSRNTICLSLSENQNFIQPVIKFTFQQELASQAGVGEIALWKKHLPHKCEDQSLNLQNLYPSSCGILYLQSQHSPRQMRDGDKDCLEVGGLAPMRYILGSRFLDRN